MTVDQTSLEAFLDLIGSEELGECQLKVFQAIKYSDSPIHDSRIAYLTQLPINVVTARRNELAKAGLIRQGDKIHSPTTHKLVQTWTTR